MHEEHEENLFFDLEFRFLKAFEVFLRVLRAFFVLFVSGFSPFNLRNLRLAFASIAIPP